MKLKNQFEKSSEGIFEKDAEQKLKSCSMDLIQASQRFRELLQVSTQIFQFTLSRAISKKW